MADADRISLAQLRDGSAPDGPEAFAGRPVHIWSGEHRLWWREGRAGYAADRDAAGVYPFEDAVRATSHCGPEKRIEYVLAA